jgi:hypothetical protein
MSTQRKTGRISPMTTREKTYTFRASQDLAGRATEALSTLCSLLDEDAVDLREEEMATFWITVLRRAREFDESENQSAVFRTTLEAFVEAAEKVARDREYLREYEQWAAEDEEGRLVRRGALKAAASRWSE